MESTVTVLIPPAVEPVTVEQARRHCRIDGLEDDDLLAGHVLAARMWVEMYLARALVTQGLQWTLSERGSHGAWPGLPGQLACAPAAFGWPSRLLQPLELPRAPAQGVASVTLLDYDNAVTVLDPGLWSADLALQPARLRIQRQWAYGPVRHVQVAFTAGYGDSGDAVPKPITQAILLLTAFLYENRGDAGGDMPQAAEWLLSPYRIAFFGG